MTALNSDIKSAIHSGLTKNGFAVLRELSPGLATIEIAKGFGWVLDIDSVLPGSGIQTVQSLRPRERHDVSDHQYSGNYGYGEFPLHSDLAHWTVPPRYFLLRCVAGAEDVFTRVLPWASVLPSIGLNALQKAVFAARKRRLGCSGLVRALWRHELGDIFRWDSIFLKPLNAPARDLAAVMQKPDWGYAAAEVPLCRPGDTLLIDNWRTLHGRSPVPVKSAGRIVERVYLSEVSL